MRLNTGGAPRCCCYGHIRCQPQAVVPSWVAPRPARSLFLYTRVGCLSSFGACGEVPVKPSVVVAEGFTHFSVSLFNGKVAEFPWTAGFVRP